MKHLNKFNEGWFSKDEENTPVKLVNSKIQVTIILIPLLI